MTQTIVLTGGTRPVHSVTVDLLSDRQPAWYFAAHNLDLRGRLSYPIGPVSVSGTQSLAVSAIDEQGCEASATVRITIRKP